MDCSTEDISWDVFYGVQLLCEPSHEKIQCVVASVQPMHVTNSTSQKSRQSLCLRCCYSVPNGDASRRTLTSSLVLFQILQRYNVTCFTNIILVLPSSHYVVINIIFAFVVPLLFTRIRCHLSLFAVISLLPQHESEKKLLKRV